MKKLKARGKVHAVLARSAFPSRNARTFPARSTFGSCDVEKVQAVVAPSTFPSRMLGPLLEVHMSLCVAQGILHPVKSKQDVKVL